MRLNDPLATWPDIESYLNYLELQQPSSVAGLTFLGYVGTREAYRLPFEIVLNHKTLTALTVLACDKGGILELGVNPKINLPNMREPLIELCVWSEIHFMLVPSNYEPKAKLFQLVLEAIVIGQIHQASEDL